MVPPFPRRARPTTPGFPRDGELASTLRSIGSVTKTKAGTARCSN